MSKSQNTRLIRALCSMLFIAFVFIYVYCYQADLLAFTQHVLSDGRTRYDRLLGALLITAVLYVVHLGVFSLSRLRSYGYALSFFPSSLLLAALTDVDLTTPHLYHSFWIWWIPILIAAYVVIVWILRQLQSLESGHEDTGLFSRMMCTNVTTLACLMLMVGLVGNGQKSLHQRLGMERMMTEGKWDEASAAGRMTSRPDSSLTMLRAFALAHENKLGERLFDGPLTGGSAALLPHPPQTRTLMYPEWRIYALLGGKPATPMSTMRYLRRLHEQHLATGAAHDYLLCALLLDKDVDGFAREIGRFYRTQEGNLPRHYREALTLYSHLRSHPQVVWHDDVMEADYQDYQALSRQYSDKTIRANALRDSYGNTYWYYYDFAQQ